MVCRSPSVKKVSENTEKAIEAIESLEKKMQENAQKFQIEFEEKIEASLKAANIDDPKLQGTNIIVKVEYMTDFNADAIAGVITSAIKTASAVNNTSATSEEATTSYVDLVNQVATAVKTSSTSSSSYTYSMNRLAPGIFAFLSATASSLQDKETFGDEAITATAFVYKVVRSEKDLKNTTSFELALIEAATIKQLAEIDSDTVIKFKKTQNGLPDKLFIDLSLEEWDILDGKIEEKVKVVLKRLDDEHYASSPVSRTLAPAYTSIGEQVPERNYRVINMPLKSMIADMDEANLLKIRSRINNATADDDENMKTALENAAVKYQERLKTGHDGVARLNKVQKQVEAQKRVTLSRNLPAVCDLVDVVQMKLPRDMHPGRARLIIENSKKWVNGTTLNYAFFKSGPYACKFSNERQNLDLVRNAFKIWQDVGIGLKFQEVDDVSGGLEKQTVHIRIGFLQGKSWSYIGRDSWTIVAKNERTMNFGWDLTTDPRGGGLNTPLHEIGHALAFHHEHQNPFAGIKWDREAVYAHFGASPNNWERADTDRNVLDVLSEELGIQGSSSWDPNSIMNYDLVPGLVIEPVGIVDQGTMPNGLSEADKKMVKLFYPPLPPARNFTPLKPLVSVELDVADGGQKNFIIQPKKTGQYIMSVHGQDIDTVMVLSDSIGDNGRTEYISADDSSALEQTSSIQVALVAEREYVLHVRVVSNHGGKGAAVIVSEVPA